MSSKAKLLLISLLLCTSVSQALTLGRLRGAALVGQRLDVTVPVQVDPGDDVSSLCLEAEVFHADTRQDPARIRVSVEAVGSPAAQVRIQSSALVDEPMVTVYLRAGCTQKLSRRYVLLADVASDLQPPSVPLVRPEPLREAPRSDAPRAEPARTEAAALVAPASAVAVADAKPRPASPPAKPAVVRPKAERVKQAAGKSSATVAPGVRLKLDPLEYFSDRVSKLDSAALLAQAAQATPEAQKMQKLEGDVKALQAVAKKSEASLADMRRQLELAQQQAYPAELVYGLGLTTLLGALAAAGLWWRGRRSQAKASDWWDAQGPTVEEEAPTPAVTTSPAAIATALPDLKADEPPAPQAEAGLSQTAELSSFLKGLEAPSQVDVSLVDMSESTFDKLLLSSEPASLQTTVASLRASLPGGEPVRRPVSPAEVSDVRQKAEFFITLGQTDQAVQTLQYCIAESELPHPAIYLDLLALLHSLSEKTEFGLLSDECEHLFNLEMPEFAQFRQEGRDLETYPDIIANLCAQWPGPGVLPLIESHLFRDPHGPMVTSLELAAFRDLMLLADIASDLLDSGDPAWAGEPVSAAAMLDDVDLPLDFDLDTPLPVVAAAASESLERPGNLIDFDLDDLPKPKKA